MRKIGVLLVGIAMAVHAPAVAQQGGGPGGGNVQGQLDDLEERVTTIEEQDLDTRLDVIEGQTLDSRLSTLEGQDLDNRLSVLEDQLPALEAIADEALDTATEASDDAARANSRLDALSPDDLLLRTLVVSPVGPTASDNGAELLAAVDAVANAVPAPSASTPYAIKMEPGVYDVGTDIVRLPPHVLVSGAGSGATIVTGNVADTNNLNSHVVAIESDVRLSDLTVRARNTQNFSDRCALFLGQDAQNVRIRDVAIEGTGAFGCGLFLLRGADVHAASIRLGSLGIGLRTFGDSMVVVEDSTFEATSSAMSLQDGTVAEVRDSVFASSIASGDVGTEVNIKDSSVSDASVAGGATMTIRGSVIRSRIFFNTGGGTMSIATSQVPDDVTGTPVCVLSYDASFLPVGQGCT